LKTCHPTKQILLVSVGVLALETQMAAANDCLSGCGSDCDAPLAICPLPVIRANVGFPVNCNAWHTWIGCGLTYAWDVIEGPDAFGIDGAGGLFYWTPTEIGEQTITIRVRTLAEPNEAFETFTAIVDDNTMTYPLWRDYLEEEDEVIIEGRAYDTPDASFVSYTLEYAEVDLPDQHPDADDWVWVIGPVTTPVETTGSLGTWDVSGLPDGSRYVLRLVVDLNDGTQSVVENQVIVDRSAMDGWPKRIGPITHSPVLADLNDDNLHEVLVVDHFGSIHVWDIEGGHVWGLDAGGATYSAPSVGDITGDGIPEVVWTTSGYAGASRIMACHNDGTPVSGFPIAGPANSTLRTTPTLADLDGDGVLDVVVGAIYPAIGSTTVVLVYRYDTSLQSPQPLPGWPQSLDTGYWNIYASASVADLDGDGSPEVVVEGSGIFSGAWKSKAFAWHADGSPVAGWVSGVQLAVPISSAQTNGAGAGASSAQPAIADLDGNGHLEIVIGPNVLARNGIQLFTLPGATRSLSAAIGQLDGNDANGLEIVVGHRAYSSNGTQLTSGFPLPTSMTTSILGAISPGQPTILASPRGFGPPGIVAFYADGSPVVEYPKSLYGNTLDAGAPVIGDFNDDGIVDVAAAITDASYGGIVAIWCGPDNPNRDEEHHWPMLGHNNQHTGLYTVPPPNRPVNAIREQTPDGVDLWWEDVSSVEDEYIVERSETGAPWTYNQIASLSADSTMFSDTSPDAQNRYHRIRAARTDPTTGTRIISAFARAITDCNGNGIDDLTDLQNQQSTDCNANDQPDECEALHDSDFDCDVDFQDWARFQLCFGSTSVLDFGCQSFDSNNDGDIDLDDFADFLQSFTGPTD
jgi:FG-GAP-like repeat